LDTEFVEKVAAIIRLFASDKAGEADAAVRAFGRTLQNAGADVINAVADRVEKGAVLTDEEIKQLYDAALAECERKHAANGHGSPHISMPSVLTMTQFCFKHVDNLTREKDREFIRDIYGRAIWQRGATPKQQSYLESLYFKLGGSI
jgi:hypothetical protein